MSSSVVAQPAGENAAPDSTVQTQPTSAGEQPVETPPPKLGQGTKAQAEHSAEATAHKSVNDPNNQLGTSLQGRTRPVLDADAASPNDTAPSQQAAAQ